jgi:predicted permease
MIRRLRRLFLRTCNLLFTSRADRDVDREISSHLAMLEDQYLREGMPANAARDAARRALGGVARTTERHREERSLPLVEDVLKNFRHAFRALGNNPAFTAVAIVSVAMGIGMNAAIFTLVNGILLKELPVADPARVVQVGAIVDKSQVWGFSFPVFRELCRQRGVFSDLIAFSSRQAVMEVEGVPQKIDLELVTGSYFSFFGARPALGRLLEEDDDAVENAHSVCVLSNHAWRSYFGSDPAIVGRMVRIDGTPLEIAGVAEPEFTGAELQRRYDVWIPTALASGFGHNPRERANWVWLRGLGRLQSGVTIAGANTRMMAASSEIEKALPKQRANKGSVYFVADGSKGFDTWRSSLRQPLTILMIAVTILLLIACANFANLLLARGAARSQEFAVKVSLGAGRLRLIRELLIETLVLTFTGAILGLLLCVPLTSFLLNLFNTGSRYQTLHVSPDVHVVIFTLCACLLTALLAGVYPAVRAATVDTASGLKESSRSARPHARRLLISVQTALAAVLVLGAGLFAHSLRNLRTVDLGYEIEQVLSVDIAPRNTGKLPQANPAPDAFHEILTRVAALPGVEAAAFSQPGVLSGSSMTNNIEVRTAAGEARVSNDVHFLFVSPGYLSTMGLRLLRGRGFSDADRAGAPRVALVNEYLAHQLWPDEDPRGKEIKGWDSERAVVVGVVANSKYSRIREKTMPIAYQPFDQMTVFDGTLEVRGRDSLARMERDVRDVVRTTAPAYQVSSAAALRLLRDNVIAQDRLLAFLSTLFGVLSTMLALAGVYGVISYSVTRRTREIGIRMSVGAQRADVLMLFLREVGIFAGSGILVGIPLGLLLSQFIYKFLYDVPLHDPLSIAGTGILLAMGGLAAAWIPARRATRIDPLQALRDD